MESKETERDGVSIEDDLDKDAYGKDAYGKDAYGKDAYGKDAYGKDAYGKIDKREKDLLEFARLSVAYGVIRRFCHFPDELSLLIAQFHVDNVDMGAYYEKRGMWAEAYPYYVCAADEGNAEGAYKMGMLLLWGLNAVAIDEKKAVVVLEKAMALGSVHARSLLGQCFWNNWGIQEDGFRAAQLWSSLDDVYSQMAYAVRLLSGEYSEFGVERNLELSKNLIANAYPRLVKMAESGDARAQYQLGCYFILDTFMWESNPASMVQWMRKAAMQGNAEAQNTLAIRIERGYGMPSDEKAAFYWMMQSSLQGLLIAESNIATYFRIGFGCEVNREEARAWYLKAANRGNQKSIRMLEQMRMEDEGQLQAVGDYDN